MSSSVFWQQWLYISRPSIFEMVASSQRNSARSFTNISQLILIVQYILIFTEKIVCSTLFINKVRVITEEIAFLIANGRK
jgi:hypothetical protein